MPGHLLVCLGSLWWLLPSANLRMLYFVGPVYGLGWTAQRTGGSVDLDAPPQKITASPPKCMCAGVCVRGCIAWSGHGQGNEEISG